MTANILLSLGVAIAIAAACWPTAFEAFTGWQTKMTLGEPLSLGARVFRSIALLGWVYAGVLIVMRLWA